MSLALMGFIAAYSWSTSKQTSTTWSTTIAGIQISINNGASWSSTGFPQITGNGGGGSISGSRTINIAQDLSAIRVRLRLQAGQDSIPNAGAGGAVTNIWIEGVY